MSPSLPRRAPWRSAFFASCILQLAAPAFAQAETSTPADERVELAAAPVPRPPGVSSLALTVHTDSAEVSEAAIRAALEQELGIPVTPSAPLGDAPAHLVVTYRAHVPELALTYQEGQRGSVTRVIPAPAAAAEVPRAAALLARNLVSQDAEELLGSEPPANSAAPPPPPAPPPAPTVSRPAQHVATAPPPAPHRLANASFLYPLATNALQPNLSTNLEFSALYGRLGRLDGLSLGTVTVVDGETRGLQLTLVANAVAGRLEGLQASFGLNLVRGDGQALQAAGLGNVVRGSLLGAQLAGLGNVTGQSLQGLQAAFLGNYAHARVDGLQVALGANLAGSRVTGGQASLVLNVAGDVRGAQIGLINIAAKVKGLQLGLINIADDVEGIPIGLFSVTKTGGVHPIAFASNTAYANAGVKFATKHTYTMLTASAHEHEGEPLYGAGFTLGASIPVLPRTFGEFDLGATHLLGNTECCAKPFLEASLRAKDRTLFKLRGLLRHAFVERLSVFAGAGITSTLTYELNPNAKAEVRMRFGPEFFAGVQL